ncbi:hypothetical protein [Corynebacterium halotolerans]|uniref:hypothetical protein n=1 Tax=Corynebacterium halotolerans TaxID=225326 RepID=UPI003CFA1FF3
MAQADAGAGALEERDSIATWHCPEDATATRGPVLDAVLDLGHDHRDVGLVLYAPGATVRGGQPRAPPR